MLNKCALQNCIEKATLRGFCLKHYQTLRRKKLLGLKKYPSNCEVESCDSKVYALGLCANHYMKKLRTGSTSGSDNKCQVVGCTKYVRKRNFCSFHERRLQRGMPLDSPRHWDKIGSNNYKWAGGITDYKNHYQMKQIRKIKMIQTNSSCELCGKISSRQGLHLHHKDLTKHNHNIDNVLLVCVKCHKQLHKSI